VRLGCAKKLRGKKWDVAASRQSAANPAVAVNWTASNQSVFYGNKTASKTRNILDKKAFDPRFDHCLCGFRVVKKDRFMGCGFLGFCARMDMQNKNYEF